MHVDWCILADTFMYVGRQVLVGIERQVLVDNH